MTPVIVNTAAACITMLLMFGGIKAGVAKKNKPALIVSCVSLFLPAGVFGIHAMFMWCVLILQAYTDAAEHSVFGIVTLAAFAAEVIYLIATRSSAVQPADTLWFPVIYILALGIMRIFALGDIEMMFPVMLYAYNTGHNPLEYMVHYVVFSMVFLVLYTGVINAVRAARHKETSWYEAAVPGMAMAYFIIEGMAAVGV